MRMNSTVVIEKITLFNILEIRRILRGRATADLAICLAEESHERWIKWSWRWMIHDRPCRNLKEVSDPEAMAQAADLSVEITEGLWNDFISHSSAFRWALRYFFFGNDNIFLAFKRRLVSHVESLLTNYFIACQLARATNRRIVFVPKDRDSANILEYVGKKLDISERWKSIEVAPISPLASFMSYVQTRVMVLLFPLGIMLRFIIKRGIKVNSPKKAHYKVASPNTFGIGSNRDTFHNDLFFVDGHSFSKNDVLIIIRSKPQGRPAHIDDYRAGNQKFVDPDQLPVPVTYLGKILPRLFLSSVCLFLSHIPQLATYSKESVLRLMIIGITWEILLQYYRFGLIWNNEDREGDGTDTIMTIVANRYGQKTMLIPHFFLLRNGAVSAYFHYNLLAASGQFLKEAYEHTWSRQMEVRSIGMATNDQMKHPDKDLAAPKTIELIKSLKSKGRLIAVFPGSYQGGRHSEDRYLKLIRACKRVLEERRDTYVLIKPKVKANYYKAADLLYQDPFNQEIKGLIDSQRLFILDPRSGYTCTANYLAKEVDINLSMAGDGYPITSVWAEALMLDRPSFAYNPPFIRLPLLDEFNGRLILAEEQELIKVILEALEGRWTQPGTDRLKYLFDPFCDGQAISRIREIMLAIVRESNRA